VTVEGIFGKNPRLETVLLLPLPGQKKSTDGLSKKHKAAKSCTEEQLKQAASTLFASFLDANPMMAAARHHRDDGLSSASSAEEE
jgi:hypothetical protein